MVKSTKEICPMCGDYLEGLTETITENDSKYFSLDTGVVVHKDCFNMEAPETYEKFEGRWWHDW